MFEQFLKTIFFKQITKFVDFLPFLQNENGQLVEYFLPVKVCRTLRKKCYCIYSISAKNMYIIDSKKYANKTDTYTEKNAIESKAFLSKSMYIMDSNQYAIKLVTYLLVLVVYFYELIVYMLLERNAIDSIPFFSECMLAIL